MYAITDTSYRAILTAEDAHEGETVVLELPIELLAAVAGIERRGERNVFLRDSDWTQMADAPLSVAQKTAWAAYRAALRALPEHPDWPGCPWPEPPSLQGAATTTGK